MTSSTQDKQHCHKDTLGKDLEVGDFVAFPQGNHLFLGTVTKLNPKMVQIKKVNRKYTINKYSLDLVKLDIKDLTIYLLSNEGAEKKNAYY